MATSTKKSTKKNPAPAARIAPEEEPATAANRRRQIKLAFGLLFLISGIFICFAIFSYFFTWKADQDLLLSSAGPGAFISDKTAPVANWGGRLGALLSHYLVYRGAGLAGAAAGLWLAMAGLHIVYGKRMAPLMRYMRWMCLIVLVVAPLLAYLFPDAAFPWGGALGNEAIGYTNGLIGRAGTGMLLAGVAFFVLFVIFALDITPLIRRARRSARKMRDGIQNFKNRDGEEEGDFLPEHEGIPVPVATMHEPADELQQVTTSQNGIDGEASSLKEIDEFTGGHKRYDLTVNEKIHQAATQSKLIVDTDTMAPIQETEERTAPVKPIASREDLIINNLFAQQAGEDDGFAEEEGWPPQPLVITTTPAAAHTVPVAPAASKEELSFEVVHQTEEKTAPVIAHGTHISIESGEDYAPELDLPDYRFPTLDLLEERAAETIAFDKEELEKNKNQIIQTLKSFGIEIQRISATVGPTVTLYEIVPSEGVRISKIRNLEDDIALNLAALGIRIIAPIPGRGTIGIEVPNANKQIVSMRALLSSEKFVNNKMSLPIALGKKIDNENYIVDLATMPHLLMAGATGQGKSVGINAILVSLLYKKHPSQLKFVMVDPKKVELSVYRLIEKHFLAKLPNEEEAIITDTKKVINTLNALCIEMDNRYELLKEAGARNIKEYNEKFIARRLNPEKGHKYLPFIVLVVDEFADLIMTAGKEVEMPIARLAQLARAVGIHLIVATQRPSVNVITGTIKANFPARIAFKVSAKVDSRTILDAGGAEQLVGRGDMLVSHGSELLRLQCAFVDTPEVEKIVDFIGRQRGYATAFELPEYEGDEGDSGGSKNIDLTSRDKMFEDSARLVVSTQSGSTSNIQRKFNLGYNRAGRIMDQLEAAGIVGPTNGSKPREVLYKTEYELEQFLDTLL
jgi:S-DNA-T family DNA segregation ATPase FtsK/SpoIIIE